MHYSRGNNTLEHILAKQENLKYRTLEDRTYISRI